MKYWVIFIMMLLATPSWGATQLKKTVCPSGCDYTSLESCMNANEQNLVTADKYFDVEISGTWSSADTTAVTIHNYTTDATRHINIYTTGSARHQGKYSTSYYRLVSNANPFVYILSNFVTLDGLQIKDTKTSSGTYQYGALLANADYITIKSSIFISDLTGDATTNAVVQISGDSRHFTIRNSILQGLACPAIAFAPYYGTGANQVFENCTLIGSSTVSILRVSYTGNYGYTVKNCYGVNLDSGTVYPSLTYAVITTSASSDTTGTSGLQNISYSTSNFTNVTSGSEDLHLVSGSALINAGTDLSATFTTDIDGDTRSGTWDIGADEYVSSGGSTPFGSIIGDGVWNDVVFK